MADEKTTTYTATGTHNDSSLTAAEKAQVEAYQAQYKAAEAKGDTQGMADAHAGAESVRASAANGGYSGGTDGSDYIAIPKTKTTTATTTATTTPDYDLKSGDTYATELASLLKTQMETAKAQNDASVDYATQTSVEDLQRTLADAQATYKANQEQIAAQEMTDLDNAALYAEMRGDKGGIGQEQYNSIMNTAAINAQTVKSEQTKLATDTNRQITDLRAQGEFEKADAVLQLTQSYLSSLIEIQQWAANYNLSVAQFEETIRQWEEEYELKVAEITGEYEGSPTYAAQQNTENTLSSTGSALLSAGIMPNSAQLAALGMTEEQAQAYILANQVSTTSTGGGNPGTEEDTGDDDAIARLFADAAKQTAPYSWIKNHYKDDAYGLTSVPTESDYNTWIEEQEELEETNALYSEIDKIANYSDAVSLLEKYGSSKTPLTADQFKLQTYFNRDAMNFSSYSEYLQNFVAAYLA